MSNVSIKRCPLFDRTLRQHQDAYRALETFLLAKRENPLQPYGAKDYPFKAGPLKGIMHASLGYDLRLLYTISGRNPWVISLIGIFNHAETGTEMGNGSMKMQNKLAKQIDHQAFESKSVLAALTEEMLSERVVNAFDGILKQKYGPAVWDLLEKGYANVGGFKSANDLNHLIADSGLWKIVTRDGHVTAVVIYKDQFGRKSIAGVTDGSIQGKKDYSMIANTDMRLGRAWAEVSGVPEKIIMRMGAKPLPAKYAKVLTGKNILSVNPDGVHYTRLIGGEPHEKCIVGMIRVTPEELQLFRQHGIDMHELDSPKK